jgi:hypothetical protein
MPTPRLELTPEYISWSMMLQRCTNPKHESWKHYGGAGVKVCDRWNPEKGGSFENFYADKGPRPKGTRIGRYADTGDYDPTNCDWMTHEEQKFHARFNPLKMHEGRGFTLVDIAEACAEQRVVQEG